MKKTLGRITSNFTAKLPSNCVPVVTNNLIATLRDFSQSSSHTFTLGVGNHTVRAIIRDALGMETSIDVNVIAEIISTSLSIENVVNNFVDEQLTQVVQVKSIDKLAATVTSAVSTLKCVSLGNETPHK